MRYIFRNPAIGVTEHLIRVKENVIRKEIVQVRVSSWKRSTLADYFASVGHHSTVFIDEDFIFHPTRQSSSHFLLSDGHNSPPLQ